MLCWAVQVKAVDEAGADWLVENKPSQCSELVMLPCMHACICTHIMPVKPDINIKLVLQLTSV